MRPWIFAAMLLALVVTGALVGTGYVLLALVLIIVCMICEEN